MLKGPWTRDDFPDDEIDWGTEDEGTMPDGYLELGSDYDENDEPIDEDGE